MDISPQIDRLDGELDQLEEVLQPLLGSVSDVASKLPLLDKAKLYVLVTYSIESMLFCKASRQSFEFRAPTSEHVSNLLASPASLRLNAVDAKKHPVFKELARVRQYFEKIKNIESPPQKPEQSLNKEAAIRFLRSDLADNKEVSTKLTEMIAKERAKAALKSAQKQQASSKRKADESAPSEEVDPDSGSEQARKKKKKERKEKKAKKSSK